jgi:hypothetical protein
MHTDLQQLLVLLHHLLQVNLHLLPLLDVGLHRCPIIWGQSHQEKWYTTMPRQWWNGRTILL